MSYRVEKVAGLQAFAGLRTDRLQFIAEAGRESIDIRHFQIARRRFFQVNHPDLVRDVLVTHDWNFVKGRGLKASRPILGQGLLTSEGELHRRQRRLVQPAFHSTRLANYAKCMVSCADGMADGWRDGATYAIDQEMMRLTLRIVGQTLFSADLHDEAGSVARRLKAALEAFTALNSATAQIFPFVRQVAEKRAATTRSEIEDVLLKLIREHRERPGDFDDMLSMLMSANDSSANVYMSDSLLLDECLTLFLAGHETTANALTWAWHLLNRHPDIASEMYAEINLLGDRPPTLDDARKLPFTDAVFRETLRLYPPAWVIVREAVTDYQFGELQVPAGSTVIMSPYATQRDPRFWGDAEAFRPERWLSRVPTEHPKFAFYPFGAGTRVCIGEHFAMLEGVLILATIARQWRLVGLADQEPELWPQITLRPKHSLLFRACREQA